MPRAAEGGVEVVTPRGYRRYDYERATEAFCPPGYKTRVKRFLELCCFPEDVAHGTNAGYCYGCRCGRCREAHRLYCERQRAKAGNKRRAYIDL